MWNMKIGQSNNVRDRNTQANDRIAVRREERTVLRRMRISAKGHVKYLLNRVHAAADIHECAIRIRGAHRQTIGIKKVDDRLVILFGWTKFFRELFRREIT